LSWVGTFYNRRRTHNSRNSAGRRYIRDTATTSTPVLEEVGGSTLKLTDKNKLLEV